MEIKKIVQSYARSLNEKIENLKELEYSDKVIYEKVSSELGIIVSVFSARHPNITLKELDPIIKVFTDFQKEYLGE